jgi:transposase
MRHREGDCREQAALFPLRLDELVSDDSLVRVIDLWVSRLDMGSLGLQREQPQLRGAPRYNPVDLLKLYVWGYLNAVRSSRGLERECHRDVECMWLLRRLAPDHKTISEFRRNHTNALVGACAAFVQFARDQHLIAGNTVAIDGSKVRAVASRKAIKNKKALSERARRNAQEIAQYLKLLDEQDGKEDERQPSAGDVRRALQRLQSEGAQIEADLQELAAHGGNNLVKTEPQAQVMKSLHNCPGYNLQTAVETESHLIVAHAVTDENNDLRQLLPMAEKASQVLGAPCIALADAGYANGEQLAQLEERKITAFVATRRPSNSHGEGQFYDKRAFVYDAQRDCLACPAGKLLQRDHVHRRDKLVVYAAQKEDCAGCPNKPNCTNAAHREVSRHLHEDAVQANAQRVQQHPEMMVLRKQTAEHPFDFIKHRVFGNARLLMRGLQGATAELSLAALAYNLKRVFNMKGGAWMRQAMQG